MNNPFSRIIHEQVACRQYQEAMVHALEHTAAAEHHAALARMYAERAQRLKPIVDGKEDTK